MTAKLRAQFTQDMVRGAVSYEQKTGSRPQRYFTMIDEMGAIAAASQLALDPRLQSGLQKAAEYDCINDTSEFLIARGSGGAYSGLFESEVVKAAISKLDALYEFRDALKQAGALHGGRKRRGRLRGRQYGG
jgi:hypothetical protein